MTNAELAVLSLVAEKPRHGYEIEQVIEERGMRDWTEVGFSSIYYLLTKLESEGLISGRVQPAEGKGPARKVYHLTEAGAQAFQRGALVTLTVPDKGNISFLLGLSVLPALPRQETEAALLTYQQDLASGIEELRHKAKLAAPYHVTAMFGYSLALAEAELEWLNEFIQEYQDGKYN